MDQLPESIEFTDVDISDPKVMDKMPNRRRRCSVIVTLADPHITPVDIQRMLESGTNVAKFKMSYSTMGDKLRLLGKVDKASLKCCQKHLIDNWPIATCVELKTCVVKTGMLETDKDHIMLIKGREVILTSNIQDYNKCNENKIFVDNYYLTTDVKVGTEISIDTDEIVLQCVRVIDSKSIKCLVLKGGKLTNVCDICARVAKHSRPYISKNDLDIVKFAVDYQVDMIIINYPRHKDTLKKIKQYIGRKLKRPLLISGICTQQCLDNFDDIIKESDGILLSREYLPYELEPSKRYRLSRIQKWMGAKCLQVGKPFYISGVFRNAITTGVFNDSEISDVTNTIQDGASGFLLKNCHDTELVLEVLNALNQLCDSLEPLVTSKDAFWRVTEEPKIPINAAEAAVMSCAAAANMTNASLVIVPTVTGNTIKMLHLLRLSCIVITLSSNNITTRLLYTYRGVCPLLYTGAAHKKWHTDIDARVHFAIEYAVKRGWVTYGDTYVTLHRDSESSSFCDCVRIFKVAVAKKTLVEQRVFVFVTWRRLYPSLRQSQRSAVLLIKGWDTDNIKKLPKMILELDLTYLYY